MTFCCKNCSKEFESTDKRRKYCGVECSREALGRNRRTGKTRPCDYCGTPYYTQKHETDRRKFCSKKCYHNSTIGVEKGGTLILTCNECGKDFKRYKHLADKSENHFCSNECYSSHKSVNGVADKRGRTSIEKKMAEMLNSCGISFIEQKLITDSKVGRCYYDFYLPDYQILIEVDGDYWHGNPEIYKTLNNQQKKAKQRDKQKTLVAEQQGLILKRIWEKDLIDLEYQNISTILEINTN